MVKTMNVLIEKKMIDIKSEPVEMVLVEDEDSQLSMNHSLKMRRRSSSTSSQPSELEPCEEFPILYGLLTAPKSFKPRNSEELGLIPPLAPAGSPQDGSMESDGGSTSGRSSNSDRRDLVITSRVQLVECRSGRRRRRQHSTSDVEDSGDEGVDSQNLDFHSRNSSRSVSSNRSSSSRRSPQAVDSSSNMSAPEREGVDENNSPAFIMNYLNGQAIRNHHRNNIHGDISGGEEDESHFHHLVVSSPASSACGSSIAGDDSNLDDNIPTSTTSGFKRKATRLETAIGNIVKRQRGRVQKRSNYNHHYNNNSSSNNTVPISMAPSSPTVSTTCVDLPPSAPTTTSRGRSEILERILRSTTTTNTVNSEPSHYRRSSSQSSPVRRNLNDNNNNESGGGGAGQDEPYAKLRDLLTMSEDQLVKRRRIEYGLNENKVQHQQQNLRHRSPEPNRRREFSPPRNNILASLLQKGRAPYDPSTYNYHHHTNGTGAGLNHSPALVPMNKLSDSNNQFSNNNHGLNDERPYKCSLCDLRFKKLPLLNRHVKTHSHIKRYVCRFCSHAFKRSDNLLAHMRTSCKGIKESDTKPSGGNHHQRPSLGNGVSNHDNKSIARGQLIPQLLSSPPTAGGQVSSMVSRSQLEEALLNFRHHHPQEQVRPVGERIYVSSPSPSPLVSTTTGSPPLPNSGYRGAPRRSTVAPPASSAPDFQSRHSKLLEILSGTPVNTNNNRYRLVDDAEEEMPLPLSLKVERRSSSPSTTPSSSSSANQSQFFRSHYQRILYSNRNELPTGEEEEDDEEYDVDEENDNVEPLNLGRRSTQPSPPVQQQQSARSRDHPEIVSILSRQPKNVVMMGPDLRKLVGIDV